LQFGRGYNGRRGTCSYQGAGEVTERFACQVDMLNLDVRMTLTPGGNQGGAEFARRRMGSKDARIDVQELQGWCPKMRSDVARFVGSYTIGRTIL
jgi:hypothetical protein